MRITRKPFFGALLILSMSLAACSGLAGGGSAGSNSGTGTGATGPFSIGGKISGLSGKGLVLQNNKGDNLTISTNGTFTFATKVTGAYAVTVLTQPTNPQQNCSVTNAIGTATAAVTTVQVSCSSGTVTIGGTLTGMTGSGLVLQNNAGDNLTLNANGAFTFATQLSLGAAYNVTVLTQPGNPPQACSVAAGSGTANSNVGTVVVTCASGTLSIGGSVSGLAGTGMVLQDNGGDNLTIRGNGSFTFPTLLGNGNTYSVTIQKQPTNPGQTCSVTNGSGTATTNVTNIQIVCPAVFFTVGGQTVGLLGTNGGMVLQNNGGDNLPVTGNGPFTFVTSIAAGSSYDVSIFVGANTQPQGCIVWGFQGTANADVTTVTVDCGHNDWTWMDGNNTSNQFGTASKTPPVPPAVNRDTPGGTRYPATWTDLSGNLWLFSGFGFSHDSTVPNQPGFFQEMWKYTGTTNYFGGFGNFWQQQTLAGPIPDPRWGAVSWTDASGKLWLFGGQDAFDEFLNDLWSFDPSTLTWTFVSGGAQLNGAYGRRAHPLRPTCPAVAGAQLDESTAPATSGCSEDSALMVPAQLQAC